MKRFFVISLLLAICLSSNIVVFAKITNEEDQITKIGNLTIYQNETDEKYFLDWGNIIDYKGNKKIVIGGYTESYDDVGQVYVKVYLQRYDTSTKNWENVKKIYSSQKNNDYVKINKSVTVKKGYQYRVYSIHKVTIGSKTKTKPLTSEIIYVK